MVIDPARDTPRDRPARRGRRGPTLLLAAVLVASLTFGVAGCLRHEARHSLLDAAGSVLSSEPSGPETRPPGAAGSLPRSTR